MKLSFLILSTFFCLSAIASEQVRCHSKDGRWKVTLNLSRKLATAIEFVKDGHVVKAVPKAEVNSYRFPRRIMNYEIALDGSKYLNISRHIHGKEPQETGEADFLLTNNPFGLEKHVETCNFSRD